MPKRPRPKETSNPRSGSQRGKKKPPPPPSATNQAVPMPDPPPALVQLLQKDAKVLHYFQSLQKNLNYDVQRWKERALEYKKKYEHLLKSSSSHVATESPQTNEDDKVAAVEKKKLSKSKKETAMKQRQSHRKQTNGENHLELQPSEKDRDKHKVHRRKNNENGNSEVNGISGEEDDDGSDAFDKDFFAALPSDDSSSSSSSSSSSNSSLSSGSLLLFSERNEENDDRKREKVMSNDNLINLDIKIAAESLDDDNHGVNNRLKVQDTSELERDEWRKFVMADLCLVLDGLKRLGVSVVDIERKTKDTSSSKKFIETDKGAGGSSLSEKDAILFNSEQELKEEKSTHNSGIDSDSSNDGFLKSATAVPTDNSDKKEIVTVDDLSLKKTMTTLIIHRRSDDEVILDLIRSLRSLIRMPTLEMQRGDFTIAPKVMVKFQPFPTNDLRPACDCSEENHGDDEVGKNFVHPICEGLRILIESLVVMDKVCCTDAVYFSGLDEGWLAMDDVLKINADNDDLEEMEKMQSILIGLVNRNISNLIVDSLSGEITKHWATMDRAARGDAQSYSEDIIANDDSNECSDREDDAKLIMDSSESDNSDSMLKTLRFNTKNQNKLFMVLERICLARMVTSVYQSRRDYSNAAQVVIDYIIGTMPSRVIEHTSQAPVLSFLVLEALLKPLSKDHIHWFSLTISALDEHEHILQNTLSYTLHSVADIWKQRERLSNSKVRGIAPAEVNAYMRLLETEKAWLSSPTDAIYHETNIIDEIEEFPADPSIGKTIALQLILLWNGDLEKVKIFVEKACSLCEEERTDQMHFFLEAISSVVSYIRLQQLRWETRCLSGLSISLVKNLIHDDEWLNTQFDKMLCRYKSADSNSSAGLENLRLLCRWCSIMGDGARAFDLARYVCGRDARQSVNTMRALSEVAEFPVVRVVNLKGREDRWKQFITQAQKSQLLVVLAVALISDDNQDEQNSFFWGNHAHDGRDVGHLTFEQKVSKFLEKGKRMGDYVTTHWRPSDLQPFDMHARTDDTLIRASVSERACSLSHIASWYGVQNSILDDRVVTDDERMLQLFRISGFATGETFLRENNGMPPTPVCVILEDDAMLVDQFQDKLTKILKELPRDFHFCSLGYR